jgi:hypothetical protein
MDLSCILKKMIPHLLPGKIFEIAIRTVWSKATTRSMGIRMLVKYIATYRLRDRAHGLFLRYGIHRLYLNLKSSASHDLPAKRNKIPMRSLGMCYDGSKMLVDTYGSFDYILKYMYNPSEWDWQGHLWTLVEDLDKGDRRLAVDSYYGVLRDDDQYYSAPYSFVDFEYLDSINPKCRLA